MADNKPLDEPPTIGTTEAARLLHCCAETVKRRARAGELPDRRVGRSWVFLRTDVLNYVRGYTGPERSPHLSGRRLHSCKSTNVVNAAPGGSGSRRRTTDAYIRALGLRTTNKQWNSPTKSKPSRGESPS
ncbi:MAG: helix-turn-helix domain-containing protein [Pseudomonadota bacterium]